MLGLSSFPLCGIWKALSQHDYDNDDMYQGRHAPPSNRAQFDYLVLGVTDLAWENIFPQARPQASATTSERIAPIEILLGLHSHDLRVRSAQIVLSSNIMLGAALIATPLLPR